MHIPFREYSNIGSNANENLVMTGAVTLNSGKKHLKIDISTEVHLIQQNQPFVDGPPSI